MKYFHELTEEQRLELMKDSMTLGEMMEQYSQPDWCEYPNALESIMGCWGLFYGSVKKDEKCKTCECYNPKEK